MNSRSCGLWGARAVALSAIALACGVAPAASGDIAARRSAPSSAAGGSVESVHFGNPRQPPVKLVRGPGAAAEHPVRREIVSFGTGRADHVTVVRGTIDPAAGAAPLRQAALAPQTRVERVSFGDPAQPAVTVVRGGGALRGGFSVDLFGPADAGEFERIAFAVHGVESSHGTNPAMWRPNPNGPQGPMQVSAAAAFDVGGGDRFDLADNRRLGRAYLERMFRRYGNWPDALAAYNWGPGNVDQWIAAGRNPERVPLETVRYLEIVLRNALITRIAGRL
jgi:hypothetical protein